MRCYQMLLKHLCKDQIINEDIGKKIQAATGNIETSDPCQEAAIKVVWPRLKLFWFSKDGPAWHRKGKEEKVDRRRGGKTL